MSKAVITDEAKGKGFGRNWRNTEDTEDFSAKEEQSYQLRQHKLTKCKLIILLTSC